MKKIVLFCLALCAILTVQAQETEAQISSLQSESKVASSLSDRKPVTSKWSLMIGSAKYANHYLSPHQYSGTVKGIEAMHGRYFRKSENLSWKLTLGYIGGKKSTLFGGGLNNPAATSNISVQGITADYAVFYNWIIKERLQLRAGGSFNVYGDYMQTNSNSVNNVLSVQLQTLVNAAFQIRYGWDFKKYGLDLYANVATPLFGMTALDSRYESFFLSLPNSPSNAKAYNHIAFSSLHNNYGLNLEMGIDFALRNLTLSFAYNANNRWWNGNDLQNYRKNSFFKVGISVKLVSLNNRKASSRQF